MIKIKIVNQFGDVLKNANVVPSDSIVIKLYVMPNGEVEVEQVGSIGKPLKPLGEKVFPKKELPSDTLPKPSGWGLGLT